MLSECRDRVRLAHFGCGEGDRVVQIRRSAGGGGSFVDSRLDMMMTMVRVR